MDSFQIASYFDVLNQSQKAYSRHMEPACQKWALTRSELDVLLFLYNNPGFDRAADIVTRRGMAKSHVSVSVASLEDRGLLLRHFRPEDRRNAHLTLTPEGEEVARDCREVQRQFFAGIHSNLTEEETVIWNRITKKIIQNVENMNKTETND